MSYPHRRDTRPDTTRRLRLKDYDYHTPGYYFITICTYDRYRYFGDIADGIMNLSSAGEMVSDVIEDIPVRFPDVSIDSSVVMPNHVHLLIGLALRSTDEPLTINLSEVVQWFKMSTHRRYSEGVQRDGWAPYQWKVWQEGFHDRIVRSDKELDILRRYIVENVERWDQDQFFEVDG